MHAECMLLESRRISKTAPRSCLALYGAASIHKAHLPTVHGEKIEKEMRNKFELPDRCRLLGPFTGQSVADVFFELQINQ